MLRKCHALCLVFLSALAGSLVHAQQVSYKPGLFPAPRYPEIPKNVTVETLMPIARTIVKRGYAGGSMFNPGYGIKPGERALIMVSREIDPRVLEALTRAIREAGGKVDVLLGDEVRRNTKDGTYHGNGDVEFEYFTYMKDVLGVQTGGLDWPVQVKIAEAGGYNIAISGDGGGFPDYPKDKMRWAYIPWKSVDQFLVSAGGIPLELLQLVDETAWNMLTKAVRIRATDPEGTDITWTTRTNDWQSPNAYMPGHLMAHPGAGGATGTIAGTFNHTGPYPQIKLMFKDDLLQGIEGGGSYGQRWRTTRDQWKDVNYPGKDGPGMFQYLFECAIGTNPQSARPKDVLDRAMENIWERTRSGVIHWGIGRDISLAKASFYPQGGSGPEGEFFREHPETPTGHVHVHNYFITMVVTNADGSTTTVIDKGHLTALDNPKVRQEAAKFGDPDQLLREDWIPAIPGINIPGDYHNDYAADPAAWIRKDLATNWKY